MQNVSNFSEAHRYRGRGPGFLIRFLVDTDSDTDSEKKHSGSGLSGLGRKEKNQIRRIQVKTWTGGPWPAGSGGNPAMGVSGQMALKPAAATVAGGWDPAGANGFTAGTAGSTGGADQPQSGMSLQQPAPDSGCQETSAGDGWQHPQQALVSKAAAMLATINTASIAAMALGSGLYGGR